MKTKQIKTGIIVTNYKGTLTAHKSFMEWLSYCLLMKFIEGHKN